MTPYIHHEKYREEFSMNVAVACDVTTKMISVVFYDLSLKRRIAKSIAAGQEMDSENAAAELAKLVFLSAREHNIPAAAVRSIGCCAPIGISGALEEQLDPTDMFLRPDTKVDVIPFVSAYADGRFSSFLATVPFSEGVMAAELGSTLNIGYFTGGRLCLASFRLSGAFDGSGLESGMAAEFGAIDQVDRDEYGTLCYSVIGDEDSCGVAPSAALDAVTIMLDSGVLDSDGIMTDRDMFFIGEDYFISQSDVRKVQSDKAGAAAALQSIFNKYGMPEKLYLTGEVFASNGMERLTQLSVFPEGVAEKTHFGIGASLQGVIRCLEDEILRDELETLIMSAEDITEALSEDFDDLYITNLTF